MRKLIILFGAICMLASKCEDTKIYTEYHPILMKRTEMEQSFAVLEPQALHSSGKIYIKGKYLFINELYQGVHVFDNTDPRNPVPYKFIRIRGNVDISAKGDMLYVDNARDLLAIDISDMNNIALKNRQKNVFPELYPPDLNVIPSAFDESKRPEGTIIVAWEKNK